MDIIKSFLTSLLFLCVWPFAWALPPMNMPKGVTPLSEEIYHLHMTIFYICCGIGVVVFGVLIYSLIYHRKSRGAQASAFHENLGVEILWAVIPFIILVIMAIPATKVLMHMRDTHRSTVNIKVTGYQWKWGYDYLDEGVSFMSNLSTPNEQIHNKAPKGEHYMVEVDHEVVVPINEKIRFLVTSNDVNHSWWVPELGIKRDAIPGFIHESWAIIKKPGVYRGQCAELCGMHHGYMPIVVRAVTAPEYHQWLADQKRGASSATVVENTNATLDKSVLMQLGEKGYASHCAVCHKADGTGMPPAFPALKGAGMAVGSVSDHIHIVVHGKSGTAMQAFGPQLDDKTIAAIITYERNAWGNDQINPSVQKVVQPKEIRLAH